eukprot:CAMPEP_0175043360 /NCGR_PEP_ID=MMETSP0052_2-20121109/3132_1 /TAXON_ID=51329 ORGANISM="Polytomella parva, Strain SAG 63-3" /NCGR_SAMPLE_ID=MMETSP0052_2 /ASSEMBLY_ACC=CAM_ASM_000194 /LENGTH=190 /DNA_ID=CAMNT_0016306387 /DNA_START=87 /DNA_END=656 /DNA_ORIENTATION=-
MAVNGAIGSPPITSLKSALDPTARIQDLASLAPPVRIPNCHSQPNPNLDPIPDSSLQPHTPATPDALSPSIFSPPTDQSMNHSDSNYYASNASNISDDVSFVHSNAVNNVNDVNDVNDANNVNDANDATNKNNNNNNNNITTTTTTITTTTTTTTTAPPQISAQYTNISPTLPPPPSLSGMGVGRRKPSS